MPKSKSKRRKVIEQEKKARSAPKPKVVAIRSAPPPPVRRGLEPPISQGLQGLTRIGLRNDEYAHWETWIDDMYGFGDPDFPVDALQAMHRDGFTLLDVAETFRSWWRDSYARLAEPGSLGLSADEEASFAEDVVRLDAVQTGGRVLPSDHEGYDLIIQTMGDCFENDQILFLKALIKAHADGVTLETVANAAEDAWLDE